MSSHFSRAMNSLSAPRVGKSQDFVKQVSAFFRLPAPEDLKIAAKIGQRALGVLKLHRFLTSD